MTVEKEIQQAELRRLVRKIAMRYQIAKEKSGNKREAYALYHFGQSLAYEEAIEIIKEVFHEDMQGTDWE